VELTVVVVTYNSEELLPDFFASLGPALAGVDTYEVVVSDNASVDGSLQLASELWPDATMVTSEENRGYAAGINTGVAAARPSDAIVVLNHDVRLGPGSLRVLLDTVDDPGVGIAVPRLLDGDGRLLKSLRREPTVLRALGEALLGGDRSGRSPWLGHVVQDDQSYRTPTEASWASGCAALISRECWDAVGPWDESFFLYSEDVDFALRSHDQGFRLMLTPEAEAVHLVGPSRDEPQLWAMSVWNRYRLFRRRHGPLRSAGYWLALFLNESTRAVAGRRIHRSGVAALISRSGRPVQVR
jgi:GT2 family glycosyltransferase